MYDAFINRYDLGQKHTRVTKMILNNKSVKITRSSSLPIRTAFRNNTGLPQEIRAIFSALLLLAQRSASPTDLRLPLCPVENQIKH